MNYKEEIHRNAMCARITEKENKDTQRAIIKIFLVKFHIYKIKEVLFPLKLYATSF